MRSDPRTSGGIAIVGAGHAGTEAAFALRLEGLDCAVTLINAEETLPYQRPPLSKSFLRRGMATPLRSQDAFVSAKIDVVRTRVREINRGRLTLHLDGGDELRYDHLILAVGTRPNRLAMTEGLPIAHPALPVLLSGTAGYVDTAGFLALQGLFTAHVTGNFVTLGASLVLGTTGAIAKLMALPVFYAVVVATRLVGSAPTAKGRRPLGILLAAKLLLLMLACLLAVTLGPFRSGDGWPALLTGMTLVAAMAIQNAVHRVHLASAPPTTVMTGSTTQIMIDLADLLRGETEGRSVMIKRLRSMSISVAAFALGCAAAALIYSRIDVWCFVAPPLLAAISFRLAWKKPNPLT